VICFTNLTNPPSMMELSVIHHQNTVSSWVRIHAGHLHHNQTRQVSSWVTNDWGAVKMTNQDFLQEVFNIYPCYWPGLRYRANQAV
jgi:hypothetical protein